MSSPLTPPPAFTSLHPMSNQRAPVANRLTSIRRVLLGLLIANLFVVAAKVAVGLAAHSLAVLGDALHSGVDALNNVLALVVMRVATKAPDEDHPYGHGKFETLGALAVVGFLSITCFELVRQAANRFTGDHRLPLLTEIQFATLLATLVINILRSEEHTSELQSPCNLVCRLL